MLARSILFSALTATTVWLCKSSPEIRGGGEPGVVMRLPEQVDRFKGVPAAPDPAEIQVLPKDTEFAKMVYHSRETDPSQRDLIDVSVVLSGADRKSIHRPEVCLQAQGWTILGSQVMPVKMADGQTLRVRDLQLTKPASLPSGAPGQQIRAHFIYWFVGTDVSTPDHAERLWITLRDNVASGMNHRWAYAFTMALVTEGFSPQDFGQRIRSEEATVAMLRGFIHDLAPKFQKQFMTSKM